MPDMNYLALLVAALAAFVVSSVWYAVVGTQLSMADTAATARPPAWKMLVELARSLVVATVVAGLVVQAGIAGASGALTLGLAVWLGFPFVLLLGSVIWESVPWPVAALHAGDWLVKLVVVALIVTVWR